MATRADINLEVTGINPKFSPSGTEILYQTAGGVHVMNSDGTNRRLLSATGGVPSWHPSGAVIAFGDRQSGVWRMNTDGTGLTQVTSDGGFQPAWSPDGNQIAYNATVPGAGQQLFIVKPDGSNRLQAVTSNSVIDVVWQPSARILFAVLVDALNYELHTFEPGNAGSLTRLTTKADNDFEPSWSPDANNITWSNLAAGIWIMNADGSGKHQVLAAGRQASWGK